MWPPGMMIDHYPVAERGGTRVAVLSAQVLKEERFGAAVVLHDARDVFDLCGVVQQVKLR